VFNESSLLLSLGLILSALHFKWRLYTTHLGVSHPPSGVTTSHLHKLSSSLHHFPSFLCITFLHFLCHCVFFFLCVFHSHPSSYKSPYNCVFSLPSRSEPSHLLNHLVKFVSSGNLLWVSHHNC